MSPGPRTSKGVCSYYLLDLVANHVSYVDFDVGTTQYSVNLGFFLSELSLLLSEPDQVQQVVLDGLVLEDAPAEVAAIVVPTGSTELVVVHEDGARYSFQISRGDSSSVDEVAYLKDPSPSQFENFGTSVAIHGDRIVVGVPFATDSEGSAIVYRRAERGWEREATLKGNPAQNSQSFGSSVDIHDGVIIVGAPTDTSDGSGPSDTSAPQAGAAYVFELQPTGVWERKAYLKASNTETRDYFGWAVSIEGTFAVIGARGESSAASAGPEDNSMDGAGAAYVFYFADSDGWTPQTILKADNAGAGDAFGTSVSLSDNHILVGAPGESSPVDGSKDDDSAVRAGAGYLFHFKDGEWTQEAMLKASNAESGDAFGWSVSLDLPRAAIGAYAESGRATGDPRNNDEPESGAVYIFERIAASNWAQVDFIKASNAEAGDRFGWAVSLDRSSLIVGAFGEDSAPAADANDNSAEDSGAAYAFFRDETGRWTMGLSLKAANGEERDWFGASVGLDADAIVVGALLESSARADDPSDNAADRAGAAYVFK